MEKNVDYKNSVLDQKHQAFVNAVNTYKEFKVNNPNATNKNSYLLSEEIMNKWFELSDDIWETKYAYRDELKKQFPYDRIKLKVPSKFSPMDYNNKNLFIFHNNGWSKFSLVAIKEDNRLKMGLSICSDSDNFSRKIGRELAYVRANAGKWSIPCKKTDPLEIREELYELVQDIIENFDYYKQNYV